MITKPWSQMTHEERIAYVADNAVAMMLASGAVGNTHTDGPYVAVANRKNNVVTVYFMGDAVLSRPVVLSRKHANAKALTLDRQTFDRAQSSLDKYRTGAYRGISIKNFPVEWHMAANLLNLDIWCGLQQHV